MHVLHNLSFVRSIKNIQRGFLFLIVLVVVSSQSQILVFALSPEQKKIFDSGVNYFDINTACGGSAIEDTSTVITDPNTTKGGQSLGGVAGTGFNQDEIDKAKGFADKSVSFSGKNGFKITTYGPPWDSVEGGGTTAVGLSMASSSNNKGRPRYMIAVDPKVIPYGSLVTVWPNAVNWRGPFLATDTGGAIKGNHIDVYDWSGDGTKDKFSATGKVEPYTSSTAPSSTTTSTSGNLKSLAAQILASPNISFDYGKTGPSGSQFQRIADGNKAQTDDGRQVDVEPVILTTILHMSQKHKVNISALTNGPSHTGATNPHGSGKAVDINIFDGKHTNGTDSVSDEIVNSAAEALPNGSRFGRGTNPSTPLKVGNKVFSVFDDNPNHVHIDVVGVSQADNDAASSQAPATTGESSAVCTCESGGASASSGSMVGKTNAEKFYNWLVSRGIAPQGAAGIVGNLMQESGGKTENINPRAGEGNAHIGVAQWDSGGRWAKLVSQSDGKEWELVKQAEYMWWELTGEKDGAADSKDKEGGYDTAYRLVKNASSPEKAAEDFELNYEKSGGSELASRKTMAKSIFTKYGSGSGVSGSSIGANCDSGGTAFTLGDYAWPIDIGKKNVNVADWKHHDGTPALDISTNKVVNGSSPDSDVVGKSVFAISDGTIKSSHIYTGWIHHRPIPGCWSIEFESNADSSGDKKWVYWYGHIAQTNIKAGQKVTKGQKLSTVGPRKCTDNDSYPHLHIDRGSPQGEDGGSEKHRDPGFIDLMKNIYKSLPE